MGRNRSEGWKHAKLTGHINEELACNQILENEEIKLRILRCAHKPNSKIIDASAGGLTEKNVISVLGDTTKSKTDIYVKLDDNTTINISLKKEKGGQVYLIGASRFIDGFEKQYGMIVPDNIKKAIGLYWGSDEQVLDIITRIPSKYDPYQTRKHRIVAEILQKFDESLYEELLAWFNENISLIFDYCFSRGLALQQKDWAQLIWYKNEIGEDTIDTIINIDDFKKILTADSKYGTVNGGTTIQLPFGFVQWHSPTKKIPGDMQFHHSYDKLVSLIQAYNSKFNIDLIEMINDFCIDNEE